MEDKHAYTVNYFDALKKDIMSRTDYYDDPHAPCPTTIVAAASAIVVDDEGRILLHRRRDNDLWALPGGAMEVGESIAETAIRETREETGLVVRVDALVGIYTDPKHVIAFSDGEVRQQFSLCFACTRIGGEVQVSEESFEVRFFSQQDIAQVNMHPSIRLRITHYFEHRDHPYIG